MDKTVNKIKNKTNYKQLIIICGLLLIIIILICVYLIFNYNNTYEYDSFLEIDNNNNINTNKIIEEDNNDEIIVHVTGHVVNPGIVKLKEGQRVIDAIKKAGGETDDANLSLINLAYMLEDGQKIYVPSMEEKEEITTINNENTNSTKQLKVNINTAKKDELQKIPGIGEAIASRIINYRNEYGKFDSIDGLKNVTGIGDSKFNSIKQYLKI